MTLIIDQELKLRQFRVEDSLTIFALIDRNRPHLSQNGDDTAKKYKTESDVRESILHPNNPFRIRFGIWDHDTYVGTINFTPEGGTAEIGYYLGEEFQGKGYVSRALHRLVEFAFT